MLTSQCVQSSPESCPFIVFPFHHAIDTLLIFPDVSCWRRDSFWISLLCFLCIWVCGISFEDVIWIYAPTHHQEINAQTHAHSLQRRFGDDKVINTFLLTHARTFRSEATNKTSERRRKNREIKNKNKCEISVLRKSNSIFPHEDEFRRTSPSPPPTTRMRAYRHICAAYLHWALFVFIFTLPLRRISCSLIVDVFVDTLFCDFCYARLPATTFEINVVISFVRINGNEDEEKREKKK